MARHIRLRHTKYVCYWRCPVCTCPVWFSSELNGKDHIEHTDHIREGRGCSFYEYLRTYGLEWYDDQRKEATQSMWMDLALARRSGQELHNTNTITQSPEFGPLRKFFASAIIQLMRAMNDVPVPSRQPSSTDTTLLESIRAAVDYDDRSDEDTASADSPSVSHAVTGATPTLPPVAPVIDQPTRRLTPANQALRYLEAGALATARPDALPSRPAVPDLSIASSRLLSCIDPMPLDRLLSHTVDTFNSWPPADRAQVLAVAHRDLRIACQNIYDLQYYVDGYTAHLSDCAGAWDTGIPLMVAETFPRLQGGVRASLEEYAPLDEQSLSDYIHKLCGWYQSEIYIPASTDGVTVTAGH